MTAAWCLNPYSTGSNSIFVDTLCWTASYYVLILILLEVTQFMGLWGLVRRQSCLNPYSTGSNSIFCFWNKA